MSVFEAILLGIIQGLTEFLPISSTGHLTLAGKLMGLISEQNPERWTSFIAVIQLGTLAAVLIYFRKELISITAEFLQNNIIKRKKYSQQSHNSKMGWLIIIGTIPIVIVGLLFKSEIEGAFTKNLYVISISLIAFGLILGAAEKFARFSRNISNVKIFDSIIVGLAQAVALIPGVSRSGSTIAAGLFAGLNRETAARFSFLLSIPAVFASGVLEFYESLKYIDNGEIFNLAVAILVSGISGYLAIEGLLRFLRKRPIYVFMIYRIIIGAIILTLLHNGTIAP